MPAPQFEGKSELAKGGLYDNPSKKKRRRKRRRGKLNMNLDGVTE